MALAGLHARSLLNATEYEDMHLDRETLEIAAGPSVGAGQETRESFLLGRVLQHSCLVQHHTVQSTSIIPEECDF